MGAKSIRSITVLLIVSISLVGRSSGALFGWWSSWSNSAQRMLELDYNLLNSELADNVNDDGATPNILAAIDWLKMVEGEMEPDPEVKLPSRKALMLFTSLIKLMDPVNSHCDMEAYTILKENELAVGRDISLPASKLGGLRRIEDVVRQVAVDHADQCRYEYPAQFAAAQKKVDPNIINGIRKMMDAIISTSEKLVFTDKKRETDMRQIGATKAEAISMKGESEARALLIHLRYCSRLDRDKRFLSLKSDPNKRDYFIVNEPKVVEMIRRYFFSRCEFIESQFGGIMKPAAFDQELFEDKRKYRAINNEMTEFMIWLQYYRICQDSWKNKKQLEDNVINGIWSGLNQS